LTVGEKVQTSELKGKILSSFVISRVYFSVVLLWWLFPWATKPIDYGQGEKNTQEGGLNCVRYFEDFFLFGWSAWPEYEIYSFLCRVYV